jgi:hypothetical protein
MDIIHLKTHPHKPSFVVREPANIPLRIEIHQNDKITAMVYLSLSDLVDLSAAIDSYLIDVPMHKLKELGE